MSQGGNREGFSGEEGVAQERSENKKEPALKTGEGGGIEAWD